MIFPLKPLKVTLPVMVMLFVLNRSVKSRVIKTRALINGDFTGIAEIRTIKGTCAFKIKIAAIKGGIIGSAKIFIENECLHSISPH
ncbi:hypothetical protein HpHA168_01590 [Helicobacter pylori]